MPWVSGTSGGLGLYVSTSIAPFGDREVRVAGDHNVIYGADDGVFVEETAGQSATVAVTRNALGGNSLRSVNNTGATTVNATCNWWGLASLWTHRGPDPRCCHRGAVAHQQRPQRQLPPDRQVRERRRGIRDRAPQRHDRSQRQAGSAELGTLTFAPGETSKTLMVGVKGDVVVENYEVFTLNLSSPTNSVLGANVKPVEIKNDDKSTMTASPVSVVEGGLATSTVTLAHRYYLPVTVAVTVTVSSANGSAVAPGDYTAAPEATNVVIPAGSTSVTISVPTNLDVLIEAAQAFTLAFTSSAVTNSPQGATVTIQANGT